MEKRQIEDLALFGGSPLFEQTLHVGTPNLGDRAAFYRRVEDILDRRWLTNAGPYVQEFERRIAERIGVEHCIATCNGTLALEIAIRGLGMQGEVIVPSFTFVATAHALQWQGITPVFCDVDPETCNLDPSKVEKMITPRTTGIIGVHLWGRPCHVEALEQIAARNRLKLLFDSSHAFGNTYRGRPIGNFGDAEIFSFHATKFLNSFEGGAIVTNDNTLGKAVRLMKNFGFVELDKVIHIGSNGKMSEISAAMGLTSLESIDTFIAANRRNYEAYSLLLDDVPGIRLMKHDTSEENNFQYIALRYDASDRLHTSLTRDEIIQVFFAENVRARRYFYPGAHRMEPYRSYYPHAGLLLPETETISEQVILLPTGTSVDVTQIREIARLLEFVIHHADAIHHEIETRTHAQTLANTGDPLLGSKSNRNAGDLSDETDEEAAQTREFETMRKPS